MLDANPEVAREDVHEDDRGSLISPATGRPLTKRGEATRRRILEAAEAVFAEYGYHEASIVKVTEHAGVALGTFYLYFDSKKTVFEALVLDLNGRVRQSMSEAMAGASNRVEAERRGFEGFFRFTAQHPALYRVVREAEFVSPETMHLHYKRIVEGYTAGLTAAQQQGDIDPLLDPEIAAWALMGMGELIGMRFLLWERDADGNPPQQLDSTVFDGMMRFIANALGGSASAQVAASVDQVDQVDQPTQANRAEHPTHAGQAEQPTQANSSATSQRTPSQRSDS